MVCTDNGSILLAVTVIINNQILSNRAGIIVQANARPKLRNNLIQGNREDGLVVIAQAMPDLGSASEPGGNDFQNNARYDINANASKQIFGAVGNALATSRIAGKVDVSGNTIPIAQNAQSTQTTAVSGNAQAFTAPNTGETTQQPSSRLTAPLPRNNVTRNRSKKPIAAVIPNIANNVVNNGVRSGLNSQLMPLQAATSFINAANPSASSFPAPSNLPTSQLPQVANSTPQINYVRINPQTIEFSAPQPAGEPVALATIRPSVMPPQPLQPIRTVPGTGAAMLSIPTSNISINNMSPIPIPQTAPLMGYATPSLIASTGAPIATASSGLRYRVVVPVTSNRDEEVVRLLAPGAFRTVWRGQGVIQVGVFNSTFNAEQMIRTLNNSGLRGMIEPLN